LYIVVTTALQRADNMFADFCRWWSCKLASSMVKRILSVPKYEKLSFHHYYFVSTLFEYLGVYIWESGWRQYSKYVCR